MNDGILCSSKILCEMKVIRETRESLEPRIIYLDLADIFGVVQCSLRFQCVMIEEPQH